MFAVVRIGGAQYWVQEGDEIVTNRLPDVNQGQSMRIADVLLVANGEEVEVGTPTVPHVYVEANIVAHERGEKIDVAKFKAKVRYRRKMGFRPHLTKVKIGKIGRDAKEEKKAAGETHEAKVKVRKS